MDLDAHVMRTETFRRRLEPLLESIERAHKPAALEDEAPPPEEEVEEAEGEEDGEHEPLSMIERLLDLLPFLEELKAKHDEENGGPKKRRRKKAA